VASGIAPDRRETPCGPPVGRADAFDLAEKVLIFAKELGAVGLSAVLFSWLRFGRYCVRLNACIAAFVQNVSLKDP
jgi:hypothetical protein